MNWPDDFINKIICGDSLEVMKEMPDKCVDLVVTSPPYMNLREYSSWNSYGDYLVWSRKWILEVFRILKDGCYFALNICWQFPRKTIKGHENERRIEIPLSVDIANIIRGCQFEWEHFIIWSKHNASQTMLGSYPYPPSLIIRQATEAVIIVKKTGKREKPNNKTDSKISIKTWNKCANDVWTIAPESARKIGHSAPFPVELPARLITIHSFIDEIILDPFIGSGTTARACKNLKRNFIGIEKKPDYCEIAEERLAQGVL